LQVFRVDDQIREAKVHAVTPNQAGYFAAQAMAPRATAEIPHSQYDAMSEALRKA